MSTNLSDFNSNNLNYVATLEGFLETKNGTNHQMEIPIYLNKLIKIGRVGSEIPENPISKLDMEVILDNPCISSMHCYMWSIQFDKSTPCTTYLQDLSTNGTYINDVKVGKNNYRILEDGDEIRINSGLRVTFKYEESIRELNTLNEHLLRESEDYSTCDDGEWIIMDRAIGVGTFGKVQLAVNSTIPQKLFAVKITQKIKLKDRYLRVESSILSKLNHPNIIKIYKETRSSNGDIRIFQDLAIGGDLFSYLSGDGEVLKPVSESESLVIVYQVLKALHYLHSKGVVHRDLKLDNILIMNAPVRYPYIVLADFGMAKQNLPLSFSQIEEFDNTQKLKFRGLERTHSKQLKFIHPRNRNSNRMHTEVGTPEYTAPEIKSQNDTVSLNSHYDARTFAAKRDGYDEKVDVWSLGVVVCILLTGISPFFAESEKSIAHKIKGGISFLDNKEWFGISLVAKLFVGQCLKYNPDNRYDINKCLDSDWLNKGDRRVWLEKFYNSILERNNH